MDNPWRIRRGGVEDAAAIAGILRSVEWLEFFEGVPDETLVVQIGESIRASLAEPCHVLLVAEDETREVVGYTVAHRLPSLMLPASDCLVSQLLVRSDQRGKGVGGALLRELEERAEEWGCCRLMLITGREHRCYRSGFYTKQGYSEREWIANFVRWFDQRWDVHRPREGAVS